MEQAIHACECSICQAGEDEAVMVHHRHINLVLSRLEEAQRRWYVGSLSTGVGVPCVALLAQISGLTEKTIRRGREELADGLKEAPPGRQRRVGGGRQKTEKKTES